MENEKTVTAALVVIGNEVLSGRTRDANLQYLGTELNRSGIQMREVRVVPDVAGEIVAAVNALRRTYDYVFTSGGIGPTHDDITSAAVAEAFGLSLHRDLEAEAMLREHYRPDDITEERLSMADVPEGAELLENPVSKAPGFRVENVYVLPGVPLILKAIFEGFRHRLEGGRPMLSVTVTSNVQEGRVSAGLAEVQAAHTDAEIGSYPFVRDGRLGVSLVARHRDADKLEAVARDIEDLVRNLGGTPKRETTPGGDT